MKRAFVGADSSKCQVGSIEFVLAGNRRSIPEEIADMDGYYKGDVTVLSCDKFPKMNGTMMTMSSKNLISCCPHFVYAVAGLKQGVYFEKNASMLFVEEKGHLCTVARLKPHLTKEDVNYLYDELTHALPEGLQALANSLVQECSGLSVPFDEVKEMPFFKNEQGMLYETSDMFRLPHMQSLYGYLVPNKFDVKQQKRMRSLSTVYLLDLEHKLHTTPWDLIWLSRFKMKGLTKAAYLKALNDFRLVQSVPRHIFYALNMYFHMVDMREKDKHTAFRKSSFNSMIPCLRADERQALEQQVFAYLAVNAVEIFVNDGGIEMMAFKEDFYASSSACESLMRIHYNSNTCKEPTRRGLNVPQIPPQLTARQTEIAQHILNNWLTIVEGLPGTGKTALITWVFSHYSCVIMMSFVGMMVKSLQKRNGRRKEAAYTIHYLLALHKYACASMREAIDIWFGHFEVLMIDEFSNVEMSLFHKVLHLFPNVRKIVLVGDHRQLKPIGCGDPMGDMLSAFGSHELTENLRVVPGLQALQEAPLLISQGQSQRIGYAKNGPISFVDKKLLAVDVLLPIFKDVLKHKNGKSILNTHIVALTNKARKEINTASEDAWRRLKILVRPYSGAVQIRPGLILHAGCKITFLKNYNRPIPIGKKATEEAEVSQPVANGELGIIVSIDPMPKPLGGFRMVIVDSEDPDDDPERKIVWIHSEHAVHPKHIDLGYATTTFKTQGKVYFLIVIFLHFGSCMHTSCMVAQQLHFTHPGQPFRPLFLAMLSQMR